LQQVRLAINSGDLSRAEALLAAFFRPQRGVELPAGRRLLPARLDGRGAPLPIDGLQMDPGNAEYRQALDQMENGAAGAYRPGGGTFGTDACRVQPGRGCAACRCATAAATWVFAEVAKNREEELNLIKSMTGYGRARETLHQRDITAEVRSVNNRYLDCTVKLPRLYSFAEDAVRKRVQTAVSRGKVDVFLHGGRHRRGRGQGHGQPGAGGPATPQPCGSWGGVRLRRPLSRRSSWPGFRTC
jgi:hypothetical protein